MAILIYNRVNKYFKLLHGDDYKLYFKHRNNYFKEYEIPSYEDIVANNLNVLSRNEYLENYIYKNISEDAHWLYKIYDVSEYYKSESNSISYMPICLNIYSSELLNNDISKVKGLKNQTLKYFYKFFELSEKLMTDIEKFMNEKNIDCIIIKRNIKLKLCKFNSNSSYIFSLIKGDPIEKEYFISWKKRFSTFYLPINVPNYYKKEIKTKYVGGTLGEYIIHCDFKELYPNLYYIEPKVFKEDFIPDIYDIDKPCTYNDEQLKLKNEQERLAKEKQRKYEEEIERLKKTPGYCDFCGAPNATYVVDPCYLELYGETRMHWMCTHCYNNSLGDI